MPNGDAMIAQVVPIKPEASHALVDAPAVLRVIANDLHKEIELLGEGCICRVVVVVRVSGSEPRVHAAGNVEHMAQAYMDLQAGAQELMNMKSPGR